MFLEHVDSELLTPNHIDVTYEKELRCRRGCCTTSHRANTPLLKPSFLEKLQGPPSMIQKLKASLFESDIHFTICHLVDETDRTVRRAMSYVHEVRPEEVYKI